MNDPISQKRALDLVPEVRAKAYEFFGRLEAHGLRPRMVQGYRSFAEQNKLYAQGRSTAGQVVTKAKGGESYHNYGLAFDIAFLNEDGSVDFNVSETVAKVGEDLGLEWGGRWVEFQDKPHFQFTKGLTIAALLKNRALVDITFGSAPAVSEWARSSVEKSKGKGITDWSNPQQPVDAVLLGQIFKKLNLVSVVYPQGVTKEQLILILDRLNLL